MDDPLYHPWGQEIPSAELRLPYAIDLVRAVEAYPFASFVGARREGDREAIVFDLQTGLPQKPAYGLRRIERLAVVIEPAMDRVPPCMAMRQDFPATPHQNVDGKNKPRFLCLFVEPWIELRSILTAKRLLVRISEWFERAGMGQLHLDDQQLEPFTTVSGKVIVDRRIFELNEGEAAVVYAAGDDSTPVLRAHVVPSDSRPAQTPRFFLLPLSAKPSNGLILRHCPATFDELTDLLKEAGIDLVARVGEVSRRFFLDGRFSAHQDKRWLFLVRLPKYRQDPSKTEHDDYLAFCVRQASIGEVAADLGFAARAEKHYGVVLGAPAAKSCHATVDALEPVFSHSRHLAQDVTGLSPAERSVLGEALRVGLVGAGALGSQIALALARQGIGTWTVVDPDYLLPHNAYRHALSPRAVATGKAKALAQEMCDLLGDPTAALAIPKSALERETAPTLTTASSILDASASRGVLQALAVLPGGGPRFCAYLIEKGRALICLWEGKGRPIRIDDLDVQLALASSEDPELAHLHASNEGERVRYGGSCSSVTTRLRADCVSLHASMASIQFRGSVDAAEPSITVWALDDSGDYTRKKVTPHPVRQCRVADWTVRIADTVFVEIRRLRVEGLPQETGGVVLGAFDVFHKTVFVAKALAAPRDSRRGETGFERGIEGLRIQCDTIRRKSGNVLEYIGEWHSHPRGDTGSPSIADLRAIGYLGGMMQEEGLPSLFLIQGDPEEPTVILAMGDSRLGP